MGFAVRKKNREFDTDAFLASIGEGRRILSFRKKQTVFVQGDAADAVFYIQKSKIKLTVVSKTRGCDPQNQSRDAGGDGRYDPFPSQFLYESIPEAGLC